MDCKPEKAAETVETGMTVKFESQPADSKNSPSFGSAEKIKSDETGVKEEEEALENEEMTSEGKPLPQYWNYQWPKVRYSLMCGVCGNWVVAVEAAIQQ